MNKTRERGRRKGGIGAKETKRGEKENGSRGNKGEGRREGAEAVRFLARARGRL